jgi:ribosomal protein L37AE/L43A
MSKPKTEPVICPSCKNGVRVPSYGVWRCPHCGYVLIAKTSGR